MRKDKEKAFELRQQGKSYKEIHTLLGIPLGTLSSWFKEEDWSQEIRYVLATNTSLAVSKNTEQVKKANIKRRNEIREQYQKRAEEDFKILKDSSLFLAGLMLYWGEGNISATEPRVHFATSDPDMVKIFYSFLKNSVRVPTDKIKIRLLLYPDLIDTVQRNMWSRLLGIRPEQLGKSITLKGRQPLKRLSYGTCVIEVYSRELKEKLSTWIEMAKNELQ